MSKCEPRKRRESNKELPAGLLSQYGMIRSSNAASSSSGTNAGSVQPQDDLVSAASPATTRAPTTSTKENNGSTSRRRRNKQILQSTICFLVMFVFWETHVAPSFVPDIEVDQNGKKRVRRRPDRHKQRFSQDTATTVDAILEGVLTLVDLSISPDSLLQSESETAQDDKIRYNNVQASFCHIDWRKQGRDPSLVPMFRDLVSSSQFCEPSTITVNLWDITRQAQDYDMKYMNTTIAGTSLDRILSLRQPTGVIFHESRCGSTLASNLLVASGQSDSGTTSSSRVWSESQPPIIALQACALATGCVEEKHHQLIRDVFYMMGRKKMSTKELHESQTTTADHHYYVKFQSISTHYIDSFTKALPNVPWVFLYRDSIEVMQSYWRNQKTKTGNPGCARYAHYPPENQPSKTKLVVEQSGKFWTHMTTEDYCAAHLAGLAESALIEHVRTDKTDDTNAGHFINYNQLPSVMWETILPEHFRLYTTAVNTAAMEKVAKLYSKRRAKASLEWHDDSEQKHKTASYQVQDAAKEFMESRYKRMEQLNT